MNNIDLSLISSLAVRHNLINESVITNSKVEPVDDEAIPRETYLILREAVQSAVRKQFSLTETDPQQARDPSVRYKFNSIVDYQTKNLRIEIKENDFPQVAEQLFSDILGYGPLEKYFNDPEVTEIKVNGLSIRVEKHGVETLVPEKFESIEQGIDLLRRMIAKTGRRIDQAVPWVDARLHDGSRLKAQIAPVAVDGLLISIRRFRQDIDRFTLINNKAVSSEVMGFLEAAIKQRLNIMIAGGTSSGKTTWLNVLAGFIDPSLSIITIEDPAELQLQHPDVRRLEARPPNIEGKGEYTLSDAIKDALRMAPDIIILGEVRREEAFDLLQAMGTGHEGSLCTAHADSAELLLTDRLPDMIRMAKMGLPHDAILTKIANVVDLVVFVTQDRGGRRRLDHIIEVVGPAKAPDGRTVGIETHRLWEYDRNTDNWLWKAKKWRLQPILAEGGWQPRVF